MVQKNVHYRASIDPRATVPSSPLPPDAPAGPGVESTPCPESCPHCGRESQTSPCQGPDGGLPGHPPEPSPPPVGNTDSPEPIRAAEPTPVAPESEEKATSQKACPQCRRPLAQTVSFCPDCGIKAPADQNETYRIRFRSPTDSPCRFDWTGEELTIGKASDCDLVVTDDEYLSRRHVRLIRSEGKVVLEDLGSANGTFLRVRRPVALEPGDEILVGTSLFTLEK